MATEFGKKLFKMKLILDWSQKLHCIFFEHFRSKLLDPQNCKILTFKLQSHFSMSKNILIFLFLLKDINLGAQLLLITFFDSYIFKYNVFLIGCHQTVTFEGLITSPENVFSFEISGVLFSFILKTFYLISLTWSKNK